MSSHPSFIEEPSISDDLIEKYAGATPRYTSYPTAPNFSPDFSGARYKTHAQYSNEDLLPRDLSLYIHIPFCHSLCYFCGCNKVITQCSHRKVEEYFESLLQEIRLRAALFDEDRRVTQIHFGGGTPNFFTHQYLAKLIDEIAEYFHLASPRNVEISIEVDPRTINPKGIDDLAKIGFNRFSIGVQDFAKEVQLAINRVQPEQATLDVIQAACSVSPSVNVDLITGLPKQTPTLFSQTLEKVLTTGVSRVAAYNFAYLPQRIKAQRLIDPSQLPNVQERLQITQITREILQNAGYAHIGMDHFATANDSLTIALENNTLQRNFQGYTTHAQTDLVGIGVSSISQFKRAFAQNTTDLSVYNHTIKQGQLPIKRGFVLSDDDLLRAEVIQQIMCRDKVDLSHKLIHFIETDDTLRLNDMFAPELSQLKRFVDDGLVFMTNEGFCITATGRFFRRQIAAIFDAYLADNLHYSGNSNKKTASVLQFSQTV